TAEDGQTFDVNVGAPENSQHRPLVFAVTRPAGNTDKICDLPHGGSVSIPRIEADLDLGVVRCVDRIAVGRRPGLAVPVDRHVVVCNDGIATFWRREILHLPAGAWDIEVDRVAILQ